MKQNDLLDMINECKVLLEKNELKYRQIRRLWMAINCVKETLNDYVKRNTKDETKKDKPCI